MPIRAVIFDFGGVLLRTEDRTGREKWQKRLGMGERELCQAVFETDISARASIGQVPEAEVWRHLAVTLNLNADQVREFQHDFWAGDRLDLELVRFLHSLRPRYKTAILSNAWSGLREVITQRFHLDDVVDTIVISAEEGIAKPDPRIYRISAARLGVRTEEAVFVDDMEKNARGAGAVGMCGIQFKNTAQAIAEVQEYLDENHETFVG
jgi:epoxide hydrolase-like predicted phosphatase